jgi:hypothetical protein
MKEMVELSETMLKHLEYNIKIFFLENDKKINHKIVSSLFNLVYNLMLDDIQNISLTNALKDSMINLESKFKY